MKNINYIVIAIMALVFTSCDEYLDIEPKGQVILKNVEEYKGILNDAKFLHGDYFMNVTVATDEFWPFNEQDIIDNKDIVTTANFLWDESADRVSNTFSDLFYDKSYERISRYNIILQEVLDAEGSTEEKKEVYAMAKILRAFNHFMLVNTYAKQYTAATAASDNGILLVKKFDMEQTLTQSTVQEAYDFILQDINEALPDLQTVTDSPMFPGKSFGYALLAKVHLFKGNFQAALETSDKSLTINNYIFDMVDWHFQGMPSFPVPSNPAVEFDTPENLYYGGGQWGRPAGTIGQTAIDRFGPNEGLGSGDIRLDDFYAKPWWMPDPKVSLWFARDYYYNTAGIKSTEVYLMKAECLARTGNVSGAIDIVNALRVKRVLPDVYVDLVAGSEKEAIEIIIDERARELMGTSNRLWDMRRLNVDPDYAKIYTKEFNGQMYSLNPGSHILIMPFARTATDKNENLKQNTK